MLLIVHFVGAESEYSFDDNEPTLSLGMVFLNLDFKSAMTHYIMHNRVCM